MRKHRAKGLVLAICLIVSLLCACARGEQAQEGEVTLYYFNTNRTGLEEVSYTLTSSNAYDAAREVWACLQYPTTLGTYLASVPQNIEVRSAILKEKRLSLDLSEEYLEIPSLEEKLVRAAVVQSLTQIAGIDEIRLTISGDELRKANGEAVGVMTGEQFLNEDEIFLQETQVQELCFYIADEEGEQLIPTQVTIAYDKNTPKERAIVEQLKQGFGEEGAGAMLHSNTSILGVTTVDGICYVNFDQEFLTSKMNVRPEVTIYAIVNSLIENTDAQQVQITVEGERSNSYLGVLDLSNPLSMNLELVSGL
jgi:germination protein M